MSDNEQISAPAGVETEIAPPQSLSVEAAASLWEEAETKAQETPPAEPNGQEQNQPTEAAAAEPGDTGTEPATDGDGEPAQAGEPNTDEPNEPEPLSLDKLDGRARITLRDGTTWTGKQLKERIAEVVEFDKRRQAVEADFQQRGQALQASAQKAQLLSQILPQAISALEAQLPTVPPMPDAALADTDILAYNRALAAHLSGKDARAVKETELRNVKAYAQHQQQERATKEAAEREKYVAAQRDALLSSRTELRDPTKMQAFANDFIAAGKSAGFPEEEIYGVADHRLIALVTDLYRDAKKYRELQANPPKPVKQPAASTAPVAQPGRRVNGAEAEAVAREERLQKAHNGGRGSSLEELARLYEQANS